MENERSLYEMTSLGAGLMAPIEKEILAGKMILKDGKVHFHELVVPSSPWIRSKAILDRDCARWHYIYFKYYEVVPKKCFHCWKVVCRVDQLDELMEIKKIQEEMDIPSKVGIERRNFIRTDKRYVALWYTPIGCGLDIAKGIQKKIQARVHSAIGIQNKVHLKRACSEMEHKYGPSDKWEYGWGGLEAVLDEFFVGTVTNEEQMKQVKDSIIHKWIEYAWETGDPSVWKFAKKEHFPEPPVFYETSIHRAKDFIFPAIEEEAPSGLITKL